MDCIVPPLTVIPAPVAVVSEGEETFAISMFLSSTSSVAVLIVVCVPLTVRFPAIVTVSEVAFPKVVFPFTVRFPLAVTLPVRVDAPVTPSVPAT